MTDGELSQEVADQLAEKLFTGNDDKIKKVKEESRKCGAAGKIYSILLFLVFCTVLKSKLKQVNIVW